MRQYLYHLLFFVAGAQNRERVQNAVDAVRNANPPLDTAQIKQELGLLLGPNFVDQVRLILWHGFCSVLPVLSFFGGGGGWFRGLVLPLLPTYAPIAYQPFHL
jgi:hypothetical protein